MMRRGLAQAMEEVCEGAASGREQENLQSFRYFSANLNHPLGEASFLSLSTMSWMTPVMWSMSRKQLDFSSLRLSPLDGADANGQRLRTLWEEEVCAIGPQRASLTRVLLRFQRDRLLLVLSINVLFMLSVFVGSGVLVFEILSHIIHIESASFWGGMALCFGLVSVELFRVCCLTLSWSINLRTGIRMKTGFCMLGFNKILSLRTYSRVSVLQMMNALTSDSNKVFSAVLLGPLVLPFPILLIICSVYTCYILNYTALIGFFIFIIFIILQLVFARLVNHFQQRAVIITGSRVRAVKELLIYIKLIKMYVWEQAFSSKITETRTSERKMLEKAAFIQNLSVTISPLAPIIAVMCTFVVHTWLGLPINVCTAYPVLTIFNCMRFILAMFPVANKLLAEAAVSVKRLKKLLLIQNPEQYVLQKTDDRSAAVIMEKATLSWTKPLPPAASEDRDDLVSKTRHTDVLPTLRNISFTLTKGRLLGVCGNVGSGKTSLICSLLDQMHLQQGSVSVDGSIAYVSQQAWIFYGTVQDNILMGEPLNWSRYNRVISCCSLEKDLSLLPHGDQTMLGEHGLNLSEGQKQRISLARAIYSNKDLYLLDDPLSAVDAHVGKHVFEECIRKQLEGKSIILVTHQLQYMEFCDEALVLKDGMVLETGSHQDLMKAEGHYAELINKHLKEQPHREEKKNVELNKYINGEMINPAFHISAESTGTSSAYCTSADQLMDQKSSRKTSVTWRTFQQYCQAAGGYCVSLFILLIFILLMTNTAMCYWWLSIWLRHGHGTANVSSADDGNLSLNPDLPFYQLWFGVMIAILLTVCMIKCFCYIKVTLHASTTLHNRLLRKVIASPMSFFDMTPTGSILSCFSRCQEEIDSLMPHHLNVLLSLCLITLCICVINSLIFPVMLLPVFILVTVLSFLLWMFRGNIIQLKKMESISHSPCISLSSSIALGLSTIQTYNKTHNFTERFKKLLDNTSNHILLFLYGIRWLAFLADSLCAVMTLPVALLVVFVSNDVSSPAVKALALCFIIQLTSNSQRMIQSLLEVEIRFISVERQLHYIKSCESEASGQLCVDQVSEDWPQHGAITFLDYKMRYRKNSPVILNDLQLHIRAGEKLGIVGRAGSGKSSLAMALFRLVEPTSGSILIDGVDITSVHLSDLRTKLSIIPQDPVLFTGTVRYNLDPYSRHSDEEIWSALEKTYMKDTICGLDRKLEAELTDNGGQLSVGQRQLMCLSRALLRDSKIVLLDDATASVDAETDALIQVTISEAFKDCTVLTITHRINRVLQADRILVLDNGEVVEFDPPDVLRQKPDSLFSHLLSAANTGSS
ncbi:ATP-binding cassette sub-family C member 12-like [Cheilinus undulatus]|uniref:ATP-binding cassette sub-family C member 12-like n=1 Tax=Cheilinus undulatus TaxID=241271 RepID=UPI001BD2142D|nr:ATP-binding cassette sub-family C member 12-like [Cheilinus undulatus]